MAANGMTQVNSAKQKLFSGKLVLCMGLRQARSPDIAMIAAECGFDAIYADMEHSPLSLETVSAICVGALDQSLNAQTLIVAMLETPQGIANAEEIAAVPGVDLLLIGSNDLCTELGIPGQLRHPKLREAFEAAAKACRKHGKTLGVGGIRGDLELQRDLVQLGARFIIAGNDTGYLAAAARKDVETLRSLA